MNDDDDPKELTGYEHEEDQEDEEYGKLSYNAYLRSPEWRDKRDLVMNRDKGKCLDCGGNATQVHHKIYPEIQGHEELTDLVALCDRCHKRRHDELDEQEKTELDKQRAEKFRELPKHIKDMLDI